jgi:broad specificity phosphatase PhoE
MLLLFLTKFDRVSTFLDSLWRSFETQKAQNYVLVTHGISIRVFLARYFRYSIDQFNMLANPKNCEMVILKHDGSGRLQLDSRCEVEFETINSDEGSTSRETKMPTTRVVGYTKHRRLKLLPPHLIQPRTVHMFYNDPGV